MAVSNRAAGAPVKFRTRLLQGGGSATGFVVPEDAVAKLGGGKRAAVNVTINGFTYRNTLAVMGGRAMIGVSAERREAAKVKGGDMLDVTLSLDTAKREIAVPKELAKALAADKNAKAAFEALSNSKKQLHTLPIANAKTDETRDRNLVKALAVLRARGK